MLVVRAGGQQFGGVRVVFDQGDATLLAERDDAVEIARHPRVVDDDHGADPIVEQGLQMVGVEAERTSFWLRAFGPYWFSTWCMITFNVIFPQLLWIKKLRTNLPFLFVLCFFINLGMWFERYVIIITSLSRDKLLTVGPALILAVAFVVVAMSGVRAVLRPLAGGVDGRPLSAVDASVPVPAGTETILVQPGESLWDIARDLQPAGDVRPLVDELAALNRGSTLEAGQNLVLPA